MRNRKLSRFWLGAVLGLSLVFPILTSFAANPHGVGKAGGREEITGNEPTEFASEIRDVAFEGQVRRGISEFRSTLYGFRDLPVAELE